MSRLHRPLTPPFVVAPSAVVHDRGRLRLSVRDEEVTRAVGQYLTHLLNVDLALRCRLGLAHSKDDWARRKQALTGDPSSRWAGTITGKNNADWSTARRNQLRHLQNLRQAVKTLDERLGVEPKKRVKVASKWVSGYADENERAMKARRRECLLKKLAEVEAAADAGKVSIGRGGRALARKRQNLAAANLTEEQWRAEWDAARFFLRADGESGKNYGNETIRVTPDGQIYLNLPKSLSRFANAPVNRYLFDATIEFPTKRDAWLRQIEAARAVCYEITHNPQRERWYLDCSFTPSLQEQPPQLTLAEALNVGALGVDLNDDLILGRALDRCGNPIGQRVELPLSLNGLLGWTPLSRQTEASAEAVASSCLSEWLR
jgi:hypothetical protein